MKKKRWFLSVDWCNKGNRGIFCSLDGKSFNQKTKHTTDEMWGILDAFYMVLSPESIELSLEELKEYHLFTPLAEYSSQYGVARKGVNNG
jgi:hypothetical protein